MEEANALPPTVEEAAILYANAQYPAALEVLESAVQQKDSSANLAVLWNMLFDLYQMLGMREAFEARAIEYSVRLERSPPTWRAGQVQKAASPEAPKSSGINLAGHLNESSQPAIKRLEECIRSGPTARVDVSKLMTVEETGAKLFLAVLALARKRKCDLVVTGVKSFTERLEKKLEPGKAEDELLWLLLLEMYQYLGSQEVFEEQALQYAITFESSPPSWDNRQAPKVEETSGEHEGDIPESFAMSGELLGSAADAIRKLTNFGADHDPIVIDCSELKRIDFVTAGMLLHTLSGFRSAGKPARIVGANALIQALFQVMGIEQVAHIEHQRA